MTRALASCCLIALVSRTAFGQSGPLPAFDFADVHVSPRSLTAGARAAAIRAGRFEFTNATMVDLIRTAYGVDADRILGGPIWLETDRFDIIAQAPANTTLDTAKLMMQPLLADRFKLALHKDSHPLPGFALSVAKGGAKLTKSDGTGETGCKSTTDTAAAQAQARANSAQASGPTLILPTYLYTCSNVTMAAFVEGMHTVPAAAAYLGTGVVTDKTELKGAWDFTLKYTPKPPTGLVLNGGQTINIAGDTIPLFEAMEKQLGLKMDATTLSTPVLIVDSANRKPTDNAPGVETHLPPPPAPEFEVAEVRLSEPGGTQNARVQNGRLDMRGYPLKSLITLALGVNADALADMPKSLDSVKVDVIAKLPSNGTGPATGVSVDVLRPALTTLLKERFKMKIHTEDRPMDAYVLTAVKPKLKPTADPLIRTTCKEGPGTDGKDPRTSNPVNSRLLTCVNMTMAQFAEQLPQRVSGVIRAEVLDSTGLDGAYDFTLNFSPSAGGAQVLRIVDGVAVATQAPAQAGAGGASDPNGAISLFDAIGKTLGLKLELVKRPQPVVVLDHIDEKPTDD